MLIITGSESFVGKELILQCQKQGLEILGIDVVEQPSFPYNYVKHDIRSATISDKFPQNADAIIHLASISRDSDCKNNLIECFDINVIGTLNLIKAARIRNVKQFIFASSEWVYGEFENSEEKNETTIISINDIQSEYALTKLISEINLKLENLNRELDITILRFGIIYGPRKNNWSAVESIFSTIKNKEEVEISSLKNGRRFVHVSDIARGIVKSIGLDGFNIINLTGNDVITLGEIIEESQKILKKSVKIIESNPSQKSIRNPSNNKAKQILEWEPTVNLEQGLKSILSFV